MYTPKYDRSRVFENFVVPPAEDIRKKYTYRTEPTSDPKKWPKIKVTVELNHPDGTKEDIFEYGRNYSMYNTFEPFRQLRDGVWREYALISTEYVRFEVVDLEKREIIAIQPYPTITQAEHDRWIRAGYPEWCEKDPIGTEKPGWGFCPVDFYVPDWNEFHDQDSPFLLFKEDRFLYPEEDLASHIGEFAFYSGCVWGDDSGGWKVRGIDLSRISEGIVTSDERFGYIQLAGKRLKDSIEIYDNSAVIPVELHVNLKTGKAYKIEANWSDDPDKD